MTVSESAVSACVVWVWVVDGYLVYLVLLFDESFGASCAPWLSARFGPFFVFLYGVLYGVYDVLERLNQ